MRSILGAQLAAVGLFLAMVAIHGAAFRLFNDSWREALMAWQGLWFVYWLAAFATIQRYWRWPE